jgi:hypothetical protein
MERAVSCRELVCFPPILEKRGIDPKLLVEGMPFGLERFGKAGEWVSWDQYLAIVQKFESLVGTDVAEELAQVYFHSTGTIQMLHAFAGFFTEPYWIYRLANRIAGSALPVIIGELEVLGSRQLVLTLSIPNRLGDCPLFFKITQHTLALFPTMIGAGKAEVQMNLSERRAVYDILLPPSRTLVSRVKKSIPWIDEIHLLSNSLQERLLADATGAEATGAAGASGDYRAELTSELDRRKAKNPRYSLRAFARDLGMTPAALSNVLSGRRNLSVDASIEIAEKLGYSPENVRKFAKAVRLARKA